MSLLIANARIVCGTPDRAPYRGSVRIQGEHIVEIGAELVAHEGERVIDAEERALVPGFVDAHTHAVFAGDRLGEFELQQRGKSYLEILEAGGGIFSTVRAVRGTSVAELAAALGERLCNMLEHGTTSIEVKSGYGLTTEDELKLLRAIHTAARDFPGKVVATALLGHALDPAEPQFVERVIEETLPSVHAEFGAIAIDAYCEQGAWSVADCRRLFEKAQLLGHPLRLHTDQFHALGGVELALELGVRSVDHLEATSPAMLEHIARHGSFGVMLPVTGFHTDQRYAKGRTFLDAGGKLVLASNYNPGSAPSFSMPFVQALAVRKLGLTALEAIVASTSTAAELLGLSDRGRITVGSRADLVLLKHRDERLLSYEVGANPVERVLVGGKEWQRTSL